MNAPRTETIIRKRGEIRDHALYELARELEDTNLRMRWLVRQVLTDLPQNRDWLNPDYEHEMRALSSSPND